MVLKNVEIYSNHIKKLLEIFSDIFECDVDTQTASLKFDNTVIRLLEAKSKKKQSIKFNFLISDEILTSFNRKLELSLLRRNIKNDFLEINQSETEIILRDPDGIEWIFQT